MALDFSARAEAPKRDYSERATRKRNWQGEVTGFMANVNRGLGIGDEVVAGAKTLATSSPARFPSRRL